MATAPVPQSLIPIRMINEVVFCPRLFYLEHVDGQWADNEFTEDGRRTHRRVDSAIDAVLGTAPGDDRAARSESADATQEGEPEPIVARSVNLGSERLGITAKLDLVAVEGNEAVPVETKRGVIPDNPERSWEPERVQLMAQALLLREHGYTCQRGILYYAGSRRRVEILFSAELEARTLRAIEEARRIAASRTPPPPLVDSPKCPGCSLVGICLPDETNLLRSVPRDPAAPDVRRMYPARPEARPLYVQEHGASVGKDAENIVIRKQGQELARAKLKDTSELVLCGNISVSAQLVHLLCESSIPITYLSGGHWFYGVTSGITLRNAYDRAAQFAAASDSQKCLAVSKCFVAAKVHNQRTLLRRNGEGLAESLFSELKRVADAVPEAASLGELIGHEGVHAALYFSKFGSMLRPRSDELGFDFEARNRRPPKDPINAMLSFGYAMLAKECTVALLAAGLDPHWGLMHQPRHGRPALALDLMEEFRPVIGDSAVITAVNTGVVTRRDFVLGATGCALKPTGRKRFIECYEARLDQLVTHPVFEYRCSWRQVIRLQARLLARHLRGEIPDYPGMETR